MDGINDLQKSRIVELCLLFQICYNHDFGLKLHTACETIKKQIEIMFESSNKWYMYMSLTKMHACYINVNLLTNVLTCICIIAVEVAMSR